MSTIKSYITNAGMAAINALVGSSAALTITRAEVGDGVVDSDASARLLTSLINKTGDATIAKMREVDGMHIITVQVSNADLASAISIAEVGLYCEDPDDPDEEIMFYYATFGEHADWVAPNSVAQYTRMYDFGFSVGLVDSVEAVISPDALVTEDELAEVLVKRLLFTATIPTTGWESYQSSLYKNSVSVPGILASDTYGDFCLNQTGTETDDRQLRAAFANITRVSAAANGIIVYAKKIPTVEISVGLEVFR